MHLCRLAFAVLGDTGGAKVDDTTSSCLIIGNHDGTVDGVALETRSVFLAETIVSNLVPLVSARSR